MGTDHGVEHVFQVRPVVERVRDGDHPHPGPRLAVEQLEQRTMRAQVLYIDVDLRLMQGLRSFVIKPERRGDRASDGSKRRITLWTGHGDPAVGAVLKGPAQPSEYRGVDSKEGSGPAASRCHALTLDAAIT
jgi:hypothetical protein